MSKYTFSPLPAYRKYPPDEMLARARTFYEGVKSRRTVREFLSEPVPEEIIRQCLRAAATAPSGANRQPWHFVVVTDPKVKREIREGAEEEERTFYQNRAPDDWLAALEPLGTDEHKPFLEEAPCLIVVFAQSYSLLADGSQSKNYYVQESVGIATGILINAIHHSGLASLTHTPSPMKFLNKILKRPSNERPYLILVVGYPTPNALVPDIRRKSIDETVTFISESAG